MIAPRTDFSEVRGQDAAVDATARAVAAGSRILYMGPPGIGRTMMARRIPSLLTLTDLQRTWIRAEFDGVGMFGPGDQVTAPPFRAPHHTVSAAAMGGSGVRRHLVTCPLLGLRPRTCTCDQPRTFRPGEVQLARFGVLYLDDLAEFSLLSIRHTMHALRDMAAGVPVVVASAQPCPCGWHGVAQVGDPKLWRACGCTPEMVARYRARIDAHADALRLDARIDLGPVSLETLRAGTPGPSSAALRDQIAALRAGGAS